MADTPGNAKAERGPKGTNHDGRRRRDRPGGEQGAREPGQDKQQAAERPAGDRRDSRRDDRGGDRDRGGGGGRGGRRDDRGPRDNRSEAPLTAGLFAGVADRDMPCRVAGCENTWVWFGHQQIRSLGKPAPKRMCDDHLAEFEGIHDKWMPCRNSWCTNTWLWPRFAQLRALEHEGKVKPPHRLCESCFNEERTTEDLDVRCKIPECRNTWTWPRQAQIKHRTWVRRQLAIEEAEERGETMHVEARGGEGRGREGSEAPHEEAEHAEAEHAEVEHAETEHAEAEHAEAEHAEAEAADESAHEDAAHDDASPEDAAHDDTHEQHADGEGPQKRRRRKRKRRRKIHEGPPERLCDRCNERINHLQPIEIPCKVHGCHSTWTWDREGQLRAWSTLDGQTNVTELPQPPRRMCTSCVEFVRKHSDREVRCGRPGCEKTWTYKTGAQLQDFLAGRTQDPIRLCDECIRSQFTSTEGGVPPGSEIMPCMVSGCSGNWVYVPGMKLAAADPDASEPPVDRMCDDCRSARDVPARDPRRAKTRGHADEVAEPEPHAAEPDAAEPDAAEHVEAPAEPE